MQGKKSSHILLLESCCIDVYQTDAHAVLNVHLNGSNGYVYVFVCRVSSRMAMETYYMIEYFLKAPTFNCDACFYL